jgi:hypothetical protein
VKAVEIVKPPAEIIVYTSAEAGMKCRDRVGCVNDHRVGEHAPEHLMLVSIVCRGKQAKMRFEARDRSWNEIDGRRFVDANGNSPYPAANFEDVFLF